MKKNVFLAVFIALFLVLSLTLSVGMAVFGESQAGANERLTNAPELKDKEEKLNIDYLNHLQSWVNDRFFLRQELITLDNRLSAAAFGTSGADSVIVGKNGWLYYADTLNDYTGIKAMSDRELFSAAKNISLMAEYCAENGKDFAFVIAPNKNSLYPAYMPDYGVSADSTNAQRLMAMLEDVKTVDLFSGFREQDEELYFAHDSHWNSKGAALGADLINAAFGVESDYYSGDFSKTEPHDGDLYAMVYPALRDPEENPVYGGTLDYTFTSKATKPDSITLETAGNGSGRLLAYRDSFGILLFPYLADSFETAKFSRSTSYDLTGEADCVLVELVERNLSYLITYVPVMASPVRDIALPQSISGETDVTLLPKAKAPEGLVLAEGELPQAPDADSDIYLVCGGKAYEAFCTATGYSVYIPEEGNPEYLVYTVSGETLAYKIK